MSNQDKQCINCKDQGELDLLRVKYNIKGERLDS